MAALRNQPIKLIVTILLKTLHPKNLLPLRLQSLDPFRERAAPDLLSSAGRQFRKLRLDWLHTILTGCVGMMNFPPPSR